MDRFLMTSSLITRKVAVCSNVPLASKAGLEILRMGGNAADAAVAVFAANSVVEPYRLGLGGDIQCMFHRKSNKRVEAINGSGRTGMNMTIQTVRDAGVITVSEYDDAPKGLWVSVPGAVAGMSNIIKQFGSEKIKMQDILGPAIKLAEEGVCLPPKVPLYWNYVTKRFLQSKNSDVFLVDGNPPKPGDIFKLPKLVRNLKDIASSGAEAFYCGHIADRIVDEVRKAKGHLQVEDFREYFLHPPSQAPSDGLSVEFHGFKVWEMRPNTIGIVTLVMLKALEKYDLKGMWHNSVEYIHLISEISKLSFLECWDYLCDPRYCPGPVEKLLSNETTDKIIKKMDFKRAIQNYSLLQGGNTAYIAVVDEEGNGCSLMGSLSGYFGTGLIPDDCGFTLHDRLKCMSLDEKSTNAYGPQKYPVHTLLPSLVTDAKTNDLLAVLGHFGRWVQPIGKVQVLLNMIVFGMEPQVALYQPRFMVGNVIALSDYRESFSMLKLEVGIDQKLVPQLEAKGHQCEFYSGPYRDFFGKGHVITRPRIFQGNADTVTKHQVWFSGVDPRSDGHPEGY